MAADETIERMGGPVWWRHLRQSFLFRVALLPAAVVALFALLFLVGGAALETQQEAMKAVVETDLESSARLADMNSRLQTAHTDMYRLITQAAAANSNTTDYAPQVEDLVRRVQAIVTDLQDYRNSRATPALSDTLAQFIEDLGVYRDAIGFMGSMLEVDFKTAIAFISPYNTYVDALSHQLSTIIADSTTMAKTRAVTSTIALRQVAYSYAAAAAGVSILVALYGYWSGKRQEFLYLSARQKSRQVEVLLNNSGQGFMSFGADLLVATGFSRACEDIFGEAPAGLPADDLLFPNASDHGARALLRSVVARAVAEPDATRRSIMLSLLPGEVTLNGKALQVEYKPLDNGSVMLVLTDVSEARELARQVEREHLRLEMIVAAVSDSHDFFGALEDFSEFFNMDAPALLASATSPGATLDRLYREVHTFKGTFSQYSFYELPQALHQLESLLQDLRESEEPPALDHIRSAMAEVDCVGRLELDLGAIVDVLGPEFLDSGGMINLPVAEALRLEELAERLAAISPEARDLQERISLLRRISLKAALADYEQLVRRVAERCEKEIAPLEVEGDDAFVAPEAYLPVLRVLGHVFRNAVDHGIEEPHIRLAAGKDEEGHLRCTIATRPDWITLEITDDGAGIDPSVLRAKAASWMGEAAAAGLSDGQALDLVFADGVSTSENVTEISGRGVGLAAVRAAVGQLGGRIELFSERGLGTRFVFHLPAPTKQPAEAA